MAIATSSEEALDSKTHRYEGQQISHSARYAKIVVSSSVQRANPSVTTVRVLVLMLTSVLLNAYCCNQDGTLVEKSSWIRVVDTRSLFSQHQASMSEHPFVISSLLLLGVPRSLGCIIMFTNLGSDIVVPKYRYQCQIHCNIVRDSCQSFELKTGRL